MWLLRMWVATFGLRTVSPMHIASLLQFYVPRLKKTSSMLSKRRDPHPK